MSRKHETIRDIPCVLCGVARPIRGAWESEFIEAAGRNCRDCQIALARGQIDYARDWAVDWAVVERLVSGTPVRSNSAERRAAIKRLERAGLNARQIAERMHTTPRSVVRLRRTMRQREAA